MMDEGGIFRDRNGTGATSSAPPSRVTMAPIPYIPIYIPKTTEDPTSADDTYTPPVPAAGPTSPDPVLYARYVLRGMSKRQAALKAGYSPYTGTHSIDRLRVVKAIVKSVEDTRKELQAVEGCGLDDTAVAMAQLVHTAGKDADKINAAKVLNDMLGYNSPKDIHIQSRSLIMELSGMSTSDIMAALGNDAVNT